MVAEHEVAIGPDGTVKVEIDTAVAKAIHRDQDHSYSITAEVVDESRRTIVGTGNVLVARKPFKVYAWVDRGYYRVGDTIDASFSAHTLDGKPVQGKGKLTLLQDHLQREAQAGRERRSQTWDLDTNDAGRRRSSRSRPPQAGQYRLSYKLTDAKEHTIEGGYVFTVIGEGFDGTRVPLQRPRTDPRQARVRSPARRSSCRSTPTAPAARCCCSSGRPTASTCRPRCSAWTARAPSRRSSVVKKDMPNFFVEAVTVADGKVYTRDARRSSSRRRSGC